MPGHSENLFPHDVLWPDAAIKSISSDYHEVVVGVLESTGRTRKVICRGHIGYQLIGFWDEVIVERAELIDTHPFLDECLRSLASRHGRNLPSTGDEMRNHQSWRLLSIHLGDGAQLLVAAAHFSSQ